MNEKMKEKMNERGEIYIINIILYNEIQIRSI
jgi:hypothetical protein